MSLVKDTIDKTKFHIKFHLSKLGRESIIAIAGMALEYYTIFLYGYSASVVLSQFFPKSSPLIFISAMLLSYFMGPLGAIICGDVGDIRGRKKILAWTLSFVAIPSFIISILPSYDQIGIFASILFIVLRSIQTLAFGGDTLGLVTFVLEDAPRSCRGLFGGFMSMGAAIGVMLASFVVTLVNPLENPASSWKWRLPLSLGIFGIIISIYFYRTLGETETFKHYKEKYYKNNWPIVDLFKKHKLVFLKIVGLTSLAPIITITIFGFIPYLGSTHLKLPSKLSMWSNNLALIIFACLAPFFGAISDKFGRKPILIIVSLTLLIFGFPLFYFLDHANAKTFFSIQLFFAIVTSAYYGVTFAMTIEHLPTHIRYTGVALSYYISYALFGGINGLYFVNLLVKDSQKDFFAAFYLLIGSLIVLTSIVFLKEEVEHKL